MGRKFLVSLTLIWVASASVQAKSRGDTDTVKECLGAWKKHPFNADNPQFRTMGSKVKVLGIGGNPEDTTVTTEPELVLVKPIVNVLTKSTYRLMNPNGWYCLKANVTVLSKSEIVKHCKAHIASSSDGVTIAGSDSEEQSVTVLGKTTLRCEN